MPVRSRQQAQWVSHKRSSRVVRPWRNATPRSRPESGVPTQVQYHEAASGMEPKLPVRDLFAAPAIPDKLLNWSTMPLLNPTRWGMSLGSAFQAVATNLQSIEIDPAVLSGAPIIRGTRIPVYMLLDAIENYGTVKAAAASYPGVSLDQVKEALYFARVILESPVGFNQATPTP
jgi:uncharacterized protein (DUF433 family)